MAKSKAVAAPVEHDFLFDVKFFSSISVRAPDVSAARAKLEEVLEQAVLDLGKVDGNKQTATVAPDGEHDLLEIDGEDPEL